MTGQYGKKPGKEMIILIQAVKKSLNRKLIPIRTKHVMPERPDNDESMLVLCT